MSSLPELRAPKAPVATDPSAATNEVVRLHVLMKLVAAISAHAHLVSLTPVGANTPGTRGQSCFARSELRMR